MPLIVERVRAHCPTSHVLVVDDNSPDGTGDIADDLAADDDHVPRPAPQRQERARRRLPGRLSLGPGRGYDVLVEMDADGSHRPEHLPAMLDGTERRRRRDRLALGARR